MVRGPENSIGTMQSRVYCMVDRGGTNAEHIETFNILTWHALPVIKLPQVIFIWELRRDVVMSCLVLLNGRDLCAIFCFLFFFSFNWDWTPHLSCTGNVETWNIWSMCACVRVHVEITVEFTVIGALLYSNRTIYLMMFKVIRRKRQNKMYFWSAKWPNPVFVTYRHIVCTQCTHSTAHERK